MRPQPFASMALLGFTAWVTWRAFLQPELFERLMFRPDRILRDKDYPRLLTSALIHVDWVHFFCNAITLLAFGEGIELGYGVPTLLALYVGSVFGGSLLSLLMHRHHDYSAVGASGGVCGVMFAFFFLFPGSQVSLFILPIYVPSWLFATLFLLYSFSGMYRQSDNIGHDAHLGGALVGMGIATVMYPRIVLASPGLLAAVVALTAVFFALLARSPHSSLRTIFGTGTRPPRANLRYQRYDEAYHRVAVKERLNQLLDKVARGGIHKLTPAERQELERLSAQFKK